MKCKIVITLDNGQQIERAEYDTKAAANADLDNQVQAYMDEREIDNPDLFEMTKAYFNII